MNIVILSRSSALYSTQSLYRAAALRGHFVQVVDHMYCDLYIKDGVFKVFYEDIELGDIHAIIPRIGASATIYGAAVVRHFENMNVYSVLKSDSLVRARNKFTAMQILAKNNIPIPSSAITNNPYEVETFLENFGEHPLLIKLLESTHGSGVIKSDNVSISSSLIEAFLNQKNELLVQDFVKESSGVDIRAFVVGEKVVAGMIRKAVGDEFRSNLHRGATAESVKLTNEEISVAKKSARVLGLQVAGVDILRSNKGPVVIEVNASPGLEGIENTTDVDIAKSIILLIERSAKFNMERIDC